MAKRGTTSSVRAIRQDVHTLGDASDEVAASAETRLIGYGEAAVDALIAGTRSDDPKVRFRCAWALGKIGSERSTAPLSYLVHDPDERVRYDALLALGESGRPEAAAVLADRARAATSADDIDAGAAATGLARLGAHAQSALEGLLSSGSSVARGYAHEVLATISRSPSDKPAA